MFIRLSTCCPSQLFHECLRCFNHAVTEIATVVVFTIQLLLYYCYYYITVATDKLCQASLLPGVADLTNQLLRLINILWLPLCRINKFGFYFPRRLLRSPILVGHQLATQNRIWTADALHRRGWPNCGLCPLGKQTMESIDHLFVHCRFTHHLWILIREWVGLQAINPPPRLDEPRYQKLVVMYVGRHYSEPQSYGITHIAHHLGNLERT